MIKFDKDVHAVLKDLEKEGFATYAAGDCVRTLIMGQPTYDWDLLTEAKLTDMIEIFPKGEILNEEEQVLRLDFTDKEEGAIVDIHHMSGSIEDELARCAFAIEAMADNPDKSFVDPFNGREDIRKKLINMTCDPAKSFTQEPITMMKAVRLAAETGFDLHKTIFNGIVDNWRNLLDSDIAPIRQEFERILVADHAGKGLSMLAGTNLITVVLGEEVTGRMSASELKQYNTLCENIDKTKPVRLRRLGLVYSLLSKKRGLAAIDRMNFDEKTYLHLHDAVAELINIHFLSQEDVFKRYLYQVGLERYNYMHNLAKAQRIVYDHPTIKIEGRNYMMKKIKEQNEAVFVEDLVIDGNDIMEAGITDSPEKAEMLLDLVVSQVHKHPGNNQREYLLKMARKYSKHKLAAKMRNVQWLR